MGRAAVAAAVAAMAAAIAYGEVAFSRPTRAPPAKLDPVMRPSYNMVQVAKQSVLLEEHLNDPRKRCRDCIKKHFLHITGLAEEAVTLQRASMGSDIDYMRSVAEQYEGLFQDWRAGADPKRVADGARAIRKQVMSRYL